MLEHFSKICPGNSSFFKMEQKRGTLHEDIRTFMAMSCSILVTMRNVSENFVQKNKTHFLCSTTSFQNRAVYEIMF